MCKTAGYSVLIVALILLSVIIAGCSGLPGKNGKADEEKENGAVYYSWDVPSDYHIGIVTGSISQSEDNRSGAERFREIFGDDRVVLATYPDNFSEDKEGTVNVITALADDEKMKAVIVNQGIPGTAEAFRRIKEKRPDILCLAGESHEDMEEIGKAADLVCNNDFVSRGYLIIRSAHELGCDTFVHISFPRHMSYATMSRRVAIMKEACDEFGMRFAMETVPDPTSDWGVEAAKEFVLEHVPGWVEHYGQNSAYYCTNDAETEPLIRGLLENGGYFIEADLPSPLMGYPGALDLDLKGSAGDFKKILSTVEEEIVKKGGSGRFGTWTYSFGYTTSVGLARHAANVLEKKSAINDIEDISEALGEFCPGSAWNGSWFVNADNGETVGNVLLIYQDTYIMGKPGRYMGTVDVEVPEKYFTIE